MTVGGVSTWANVIRNPNAQDKFRPFIVVAAQNPVANDPAVARPMTEILLRVQGFVLGHEIGMLGTWDRYVTSSTTPVVVKSLTI